ncbi:hypothetical protein DFH08DRAFT_860878 [Mycena albidolilacea]|uniref:Queuosine 5'-phosphate N-glycosylase/hydrolase n=1 Tax=Mycena albidolilacea TaxID=1033008 RepID=A0AAD7EUK4_9AGAR|nr:hypothetical protein DFH08DRAFT_860878 [Mycena albidolilacea]
MAFPPSGEYLQSIRTSSRALREAANILIEEHAIKRLLLSPAFTSSFKRVSAHHGLAMPLNFPSPGAELNLLSILSLLNFGSGYRAPLHAETGRGAWDCMRAFAFSLYITSSVDEDDLLSARGIQNISEARVAELMRVNVHTEKPHETLQHVTIGELGGPMYDLVKLVCGVLNETGGILVNMGYPDLGMFVLEALKEGKKAISDGNNHADVEVVLERLVRAFPAFQDMAVVEGQKIFCFKKALFLIHAVSVRFGSADPALFPVPSTSHLPVFSDNVLPSLLIHLGVIDISGSPNLSTLFPHAGAPEQLAPLLATATVGTGDAKTLPKDGPVLSTNQAYILRAAAVDACELITEIAHKLDEPSLDWLREIQLPSLDMWIWAVAKDRSDYRQLERFVLRETVFF